MLVTDEMPDELVLNVDDDAVQLVNVLLETAKRLLLTMLLPVYRLMNLL